MQQTGTLETPINTTAIRTIIRITGNNMCAIERAKAVAQTAIHDPESIAAELTIPSITTLIMAPITGTTTVKVYIKIMTMVIMIDKGSTNPTFTDPIVGTGQLHNWVRLLVES